MGGMSDGVVEMMRGPAGTVSGGRAKIYSFRFS